MRLFSHEIITSLSGIVEVMHAVKGQDIFLQGSTGKEMHILIQGELEVCKVISSTDDLLPTTDPAPAAAISVLAASRAFTARCIASDCLSADRTVSRLRCWLRPSRFRGTRGAEHGAAAAATHPAQDGDRLGFLSEGSFFGEVSLLSNDTGAEARFARDGTAIHGLTRTPCPSIIWTRARSRRFVSDTNRVLTGPSAATGARPGYPGLHGLHHML